MVRYGGRSEVFPTHVGVFLVSGDKGEAALSLPHARGGVSQGDQSRVFTFRSSPRTWGCFLIFTLFALIDKVFPTHVGVFLILEIW